MSTIDEMKAEILGALNGVEAVGADLANRLMALVGHDASAALGHILDVVIANNVDLKSLMTDAVHKIDDTLLALVSKVDGVLPQASTAAPPAAGPVPQSGGAAA